MAIDRPDPASALTLPEPSVVPQSTAAAGARLSRRERYKELARALMRSKTFVVGAAILLFWIVDAIVWRWVVPHQPDATDVIATLKGPSTAHWFGTDALGRDVFSRVLAGAQSVLTIAPLATALGIAGGVIVGLVTGYYRGIVDNVIMRVVDGMLAFPLIIIAVLVLAVAGSSTANVVFVIAIVFTPLVARTVRSAVLVEREREYVAAAKLRGESGPYIMGAEILPNITGPIAVEATVRLGYAIFTSATLSFLGLGLRPPSPDWGLAVADGRAYLQIASWIVLFPALALATLVVAVNLVADGLKQVVEE
ncbi:MAG: ABC transporter permease [Actinobacteria bacterium]|nr:MAG: ABC transporter permease [Actinomycetota bacterium]